MEKETYGFRSTLLEETLVLLRLPSIISLILVAVFIGPLGNFLYSYTVSYDAVGSLYRTFISANAEQLEPIVAVQSNWFSVAGNILWYVFLFYAVFIIGYLRMRLIKAGPDLSSLAPHEREDVRRIFKMASSYIPQLAIMSIFLFVYATSVPELIGRGELTLVSTPIYILRSLVRSLTFGSVLWLYFASLWGLYRFGKQDLRLKSYQEDPMLGTKKLGSLAFSFSVTYFIGLTLFAGQMILGSLSGQTSMVNVTFMLVLVPVGIALLFIAPLVSTHRKMLQAKKTEIASTNKLLSELISRVKEADGKDEQNMIRLMTLETTERKITSIKTWPIENPVIGKLGLIACSVAAALVARLILIFLHI